MIWKTACAVLDSSQFDSSQFDSFQLAPALSAWGTEVRLALVAAAVLLARRRRSIVNV